MTAVAKPYFAKVKAACEMRPSGVPRVSDEELGEILVVERGDEDHVGRRGRRCS